tara:strand:+ start:170 stop:436 length:267 start_codon:yes stop_codon:yes gene_type:complete
MTISSIRVHPSRPRSPQYPPSYEFNLSYPQQNTVNANVLPQITNAIPIDYSNNVRDIDIDNSNNCNDVCFVFSLGFVFGMMIGLLIFL